jgi:hypothetical protein
MVRFPSAVVQGGPANVAFDPGGEAAKEDDGMTIRSLRLKPEALSPDGELLLFAPPIVTGFIGAPLALAAMAAKRRGKAASGRNWAKRRAYEG